MDHQAVRLPVVDQKARQLTVRGQTFRAEPVAPRRGLLLNRPETTPYIPTTTAKAPPPLTQPLSRHSVFRYSKSAFFSWSDSWVPNS
jgi:hypothetical protein